MGKFIGWDIAVPAHATCNNCGMGKEQKKSCCNDKQAVFSVAKDQLASIISDVPNSHFVYTQPQYSSLVNASLIINDDVPQSIHSPPLIQPVPGFILNCIFRI
jgi:hypothetical protein